MWSLRSGAPFNQGTPSGAGGGCKGLLSSVKEAEMGRVECSQGVMAKTGFIYGKSTLDGLSSDRASCGISNALNHVAASLICQVHGT